MPAELAEPLDAWLAPALAASREAAGRGLARRLPDRPGLALRARRRLLRPGGRAGIWLPSVDRVGRYFPCSLVAPLAARRRRSRCPGRRSAWYDRVEELALAVLEDQSEPASSSKSTWTSSRAPDLPEAGRLPWRLPFATRGGWQLAALAPIGSLWWGDGSPRVPASLLACAGLPPPAAFAAMLDGGFAAHGWAEPAA